MAGRPGPPLWRESAGENQRVEEYGERGEKATAAAVRKHAVAEARCRTPRRILRLVTAETTAPEISASRVGIYGIRVSKK